MCSRRASGEERDHLEQLQCDGCLGRWTRTWEALESWLRLPSSLGGGSPHLVTLVCAPGEMP